MTKPAGKHGGGGRMGNAIKAATFNAE